MMGYLLVLQEEEEKKKKKIILIGCSCNVMCIKKKEKGLWSGG